MTTIQDPLQIIRSLTLVTGHELRLRQQQRRGSVRQRVRGHRVRRRGRAAGGRLHHWAHLRRHQRPGDRLHFVRGRSVHSRIRSDGTAREEFD